MVAKCCTSLMFATECCVHLSLVDLGTVSGVHGSLWWNDNNTLKRLLPELDMYEGRRLQDPVIEVHFTYCRNDNTLLLYTSQIISFYPVFNSSALLRNL